jgi:hypothetical protein
MTITTTTVDNGRRSRVLGSAREALTAEPGGAKLLSVATGNQGSRRGQTMRTVVSDLEGSLLEACSYGVFCPCWVGAEPDGGISWLQAAEA